MLTIKQLIRTLYNALIQKLKNHRGNWEQNDPTADDYIKNRPFYTDETNKETVVKTRTFTATNPYWWGSPFAFIPIAGEAYKVTFDDKEYICIGKIDNWGSKYIGNISIDDGDLDTGEPFFYYWYDSGNYNLCVRYQGQHTITIEKIKIEKLDKRYLPDLGLAPVATSGSYYDLEDTPTVYSDVVRYGASQSLTDAQKQIARNNISAVSSSEITGVVKYSEEQTLTEEQKNQARDNIGAVNDYNELINTPLKRSVVPLVGEVIYWDGDTENRPFINTSMHYYYLVSKKDYSYLLYTDLKQFYSKITIYNDGRVNHTDLDAILSISTSMSGENHKRWGSEGDFFIVYNSTDEMHPNGLYLRYHSYSSQNYDYCSELHLPFICSEGALNLTNTVISNKTKSFKITIDNLGTPTLTNTADPMPIKIATEGAKDSIALVDQVNGHTYLVCMRDGNLVTCSATRELAITNSPTKRTYFVGDVFEPDGMIIIAKLYDGTTKEITNYTYSKEPLTEGMTSVKISYYEGGVTHIIEVPIKIKPFTEALIDFEYIDNGDGTYTITAWKGTYNGEPSTEMIIPNYECIIV